jgi:hypothetical protein
VRAIKELERGNKAGTLLAYFPQKLVRSMPSLCFKFSTFRRLFLSKAWFIVHTSNASASKITCELQQHKFKRKEWKLFHFLVLVFAFLTCEPGKTQIQTQDQKFGPKPNGQ